MPLPTLLVAGSYTNVGKDQTSLMLRTASKTRRGIDMIKFILDRRVNNTDSSIYILVGRTGSGKSTVFPSMLTKSILHTAQPSTIMCSEPKVILCVSNAEKICIQDKKDNETPMLELGNTVGYSTGPLKCKPSGTINIQYCTARIVLNNINSTKIEQLANIYPYILVDEAHEQSLETLFLLDKIKQINEMDETIHKPTFIIMSATLDVKAFCKYFKLDYKCPWHVGYIEGASNYKIIKYHLVTNTGIPDYCKMMIDYIRDECIPRIKDESDEYNGKRNDILVFSTGMYEIKFLLYGLSKLDNVLTVNGETKMKDIDKFRSSHTDWHVLAISAMSDDLSGNKAPQRVFEDKNIVDKEIRIFISTNAAEAGITIDTLAWCLDCGWTKRKLCFPLSNSEELVTIPICKSAYIQRYGRVGRVNPGYFTAFYDKECVDHMSENDPPSTINTKDVCADYLASLRTMMLPTIIRCSSPLVLANKYNVQCIYSYLAKCLMGDTIYDPVTNMHMLYPLAADVNINTCKKLILSGELTPEMKPNRLYRFQAIETTYGERLFIILCIIFQVNSFFIGFAQRYYETLLRNMDYGYRFPQIGQSTMTICDKIMLNSVGQGDTPNVFKLLCEINTLDNISMLCDKYNVDPILFGESIVAGHEARMKLMDIYRYVLHIDNDPEPNIKKLIRVFNVLHLSIK